MQIAIGKSIGAQFFGGAVLQYRTIKAREEIVKVWAEQGQAREEVHDVACSGDALADPETRRCPDNGASVDLATRETQPGTGAGQLLARWTDPDWRAGQGAAYCVRVLENPTCRWSTWDAVRAGTPPNPALAATLQARAWSSPIWIDQEIRTGTQLKTQNKIEFLLSGSEALTE